MIFISVYLRTHMTGAIFSEWGKMRSVPSELMPMNLLTVGPPLHHVSRISTSVPRLSPHAGFDTGTKENFLPERKLTRDHQILPDHILEGITRYYQISPVRYTHGRAYLIRGRH